MGASTEHYPPPSPTPHNAPHPPGTQPPSRPAHPPNHPFASYISPLRLSTSSTCPSVASSSSSFYSGPSASSPSYGLSPPHTTQFLVHSFPRHAEHDTSSSSPRHNPHPHPAGSMTAPPTYASLPTELSLFDPRPRHTLLQDVEYILGKKLHFPFLARYTSRTRTNSHRGGGNECPNAGKTDTREKQRTRGRRLTKEKAYDGDWALWEGTVLVPGKVAIVSKEAGRGKVHGGCGGNWV